MSSIITLFGKAVEIFRLLLVLELSLVTQTVFSYSLYLLHSKIQTTSDTSFLANC